MNVETFHAIAKRIVADAELHDLPGKLTNLVAQLQNRMNQPAEASFVKAVDKQISDLREVLPKLGTNSFPPLWKEYLAETNSNRLIGDILLDEIEEILQKNGVTPSIAHGALKDIADEISEDIKQLKAADRALDRFGIGIDQPEAGTVELGVLIPRAAVHENLSEFGAELRKLSRIFSVFCEVVHGNRPDIKLKTVASSEFSILCLLDWETAKLVAQTISTLIEGYKIIMDLKEKIQGLREAGVPEESLAPLIDHANQKMESTILAVSEDIITRFPDGRVQETRKKELKIEMRGALGEIATRIDKGFSFEIRPALSAPNEEEGSKEADARKLQQQQYAEIASKQTTLQYLKMEGDPILTLPGLPEAEAKKKANG
ncbi:MAG: hypothetical protein ACTHN2_06970 [Nitrobacter sp.]